MKKYSVQLDGQYIGYSFLESAADPSMGGVAGKLFLKEIESGYEFFSSYCKKENVPVNSDSTDENYIDTQSFNQEVERLKVFNPDGVQIKGAGIYVTGFDDDFTIVIFGVPYPFYEQEFPHHSKLI